MTSVWSQNHCFVFADNPMSSFEGDRMEAEGRLCRDARHGNPFLHWHSAHVAVVLLAKTEAGGLPHIPSLLKRDHRKMCACFQLFDPFSVVQHFDRCPQNCPGIAIWDQTTVSLLPWTVNRARTGKVLWKACCSIGGLGRDRAFGEPSWVCCIRTASCGLTASE